MKKLAIVGAEQRTRSNAPFDDPDYEIWCISNWANAEWMKRCDAVIELHAPGLYKKHPNDPNYWTWLRNNKTATVYMQSPDRLVNKSVEMPLDNLLALTNGVKTMGRDAKVINSSIAFALALAIHLKYRQIDLYGVEMASSSEYRSQQPVFMFWAGFAAGQGIKLNINCTDKLFDQPLYGYETAFSNEKLHNYIAGLQEQKNEIIKQQHMVDGAEMMLRQLMEEGV